uniref:Uncharacterized protein n=1 Tax=Salix viminalis TaxID=40686 RepID=A0A6N2NKT9_SALVM
MGDAYATVNMVAMFMPILPLLFERRGDFFGSMRSHRTMNMDFTLNLAPIKAITVTPIIVAAEAVTFVVSTISTSFLIGIKTTLVAAINTATVV